MTIIVTDENRATWEARLTEAETALHQVMVGTGVASLSYDGETVTYTRSSAAQLRAYVNELQKALGKITQSRPRGRTFISSGLWY